MTDAHAGGTSKFTIIADGLSSAVHHSQPVITQGRLIVDEAKVDAAETAVRNASNAENVL